MNTDLFFTFLFVGLMGTCSLYMGLKFIFRRLACSRWNEVTGTIVSTDMIVHKSRRGKGYQVQVKYEYPSEQGETVQGSRISFRLGFDVFERQPAAEAWLRQHKKGDTVTVWYDPDNPGESVLDPGLGDSYIVWFLLIGFGLLMFYADALLALRALDIISVDQARALMGMGI